MKKHEQIVHLASAGAIETFVVFRCYKCETKYSEQTPYTYLAARKAVATGWRVKNSDDILCPGCAGERS